MVTWRACSFPSAPFTGSAPPLAEKRFRRRTISVIVAPFRFNDNPEVT
jgi:hypothetical protein